MKIGERFNAILDDFERFVIALIEKVLGWTPPGIH